MKLVLWRFLSGSIILLLVDLLWVASSEITEYLYHDKNYNKPFFIAYTKSIMFAFYLFGFIFCNSWWSQKNHLSDYYSIVSNSDQQNLTLENEDDIEVETNNEDELTNTEDSSINCDSQDIELVKSSTSSNFISDSVWLPIKRCSDTSSLSGKSSETEDEGNNSTEEHLYIEDDQFNSIINDKRKKLTGYSNINYKKVSSNRPKNKKYFSKSKLRPKRSVRFSDLIEVRQLSDKHADDAFLSRLSYSSFMRVLYQRNRQKLDTEDSVQESQNSTDDLYNMHKLNIKETALLAFYFTWIWFAAHLSFHMGLQYTEAGLVNVLSSTTPLFTLLLGILFPSGAVTDSLSLTKLLCVLISISNVAMISNIEPVNHSLKLLKYTSVNSNIPHETILPLGSIWSLCGAFFYAVYIVLMRYNIPHDSMLNFPMFFGFIGLFSMIVMFPIILFLNFTQIEVFQWPNQEQWFLILVNGLCGTVISELLWLLGSFMTSSLVGTIAVSFTIPFSVFFDVFFKEIEYPRLFFFGIIPMFFTFVIIIFISQYDNWDPVLSLLEKCLHLFGSSKLQRHNIRLETGNSNSFENKTSDEITNQTAINSVQRDQTPPEFAETFLIQDESSNCISLSNNRRFSGGKKEFIPETANTSTSARHFSFKRIEDEDKEQTLSLIGAEDSDII